MFRKLLKNTILYLIYLIEIYQHRTKKLDELNELKKVIDILKINNLSVESDYGFVPIEEINLTQPYTQYELELENGLKLECANTHIIYKENHEESFVKDLKIGDSIITKKGLSKIKSLNKSKHKLCMYDLSVNGPQLSYYINGILSHNTVSASIFLLHTVLFNSDKGVMIVANKGNTVKEIIKKIKDIYKLLPFFLQQGVVNWNEKSLAFENGSRIQTENRTKDPSIGFTIDVLYLDEFAKVPANIIESYYASVVPTVSSISNSKIIITSTPEGFNLFHDLLIDAEREEDDPLKNEYAALRVYWWQVDGRMDTKIYPYAYKLKNYNIDREYLKNILLEYNYELTDKIENNKEYIYVKFKENDESTNISEIKKIRIPIKIKNHETNELEDKLIPLTEIANVTSWKEQETKLIGGEDKFKQEYDLEFVTGDRTLFDSEQLTILKKNSEAFEYVPHKIFDDNLSLPYNNLKWISNTNLFNINKAKDYYIVASVDLSEGLNQDYSVINIFRLVPMPKEIIELNYEKMESLFNFFRIEQIGMFRSNVWSIGEVSEIFYLLFFELFDPDKCKIALEYNTYGAELLSKLVYVFDEKNNYSNGIFLRYKHSKDDTKLKVGMKINSGEHEASKKLLVKEFQSAVKAKMIKFVNDVTIRELSTFVKKETPSGNYTYATESKNDDCLLPDTLIKTKTGYKKIKDIKIGELVLTHTGKYKSVTNKIIKDFDGDMYKVKFCGQPEIDITYNHPMYMATYNSNKKIFNDRIWIEPDKLEYKKHKCINIKEFFENNKNEIIKYTDLFEKNILCAEKNIKLKEIILNKDFAKFLGLFLADGNCYKPNDTSYRLSLAFHKNHVELIDEMKNYIKSLGLNYSERKIEENSNSYVLTFHNKTLYELLIKCYDIETREKILPEYAYKLGNDLKYVLEYWLKGDGWENKKKMEKSKIGCSTSFQLALSMRDIALNLDLITRISRNKRKRYEVKSKDQYWVQIYENKNIKGTSLKKLSNFEYSSSLKYSNKYHYKGLTYNLEVEDDNSYIANGIVVHNCVMSLITISSIFKHVGFKNMVETMYEKLEHEYKSFIDSYLTKIKSTEKLDYDSVLNNHKSIYGNKQKINNDLMNKKLINKYYNRHIY